MTTVTDLSSLIDDVSVILIDSIEGSSIGRDFNDKSSLFEYIFLAVIQLNNKNNRRGCKWGRQHYQFFKASKDNSMTLSNKRHMSTGYYFSWGMTDNYGRSSNSSLV